MIPIYILGLLIRFGPQHGYQIKKTLAEHVSDFTEIKLPTIYYHLEKMEQKGLLGAVREQEGSRPEKTVYTITDKGRKAFITGLQNRLSTLRFRPSFDVDAAFYFGEYLDPEEMRGRLAAYTQELERVLDAVERHRAEVLCHIPEDARSSAEILFNHHILHYRAERTWALDAVKKLDQGGGQIGG